MKFEFYGAAGCVTGSCHILKVNGKTILLDCGLYQGKDEKERGNDIFAFNPKDIDYVILSHAHIDHSGRIPLLYKQGFKGEIICTEGTMDLCSVMLPDSGHIQEMDVEWKNRKRLRQGLGPIEPLYTAKIAEIAMYLFRGYPYNQIINLFDGFRIRFRDAGHLLGSAIVELFIKEEGKEEVKIVYTGDLGNKNIPIIKDPATVDYADYLIMESTYGDRLHKNVNEQLEQLVFIIQDTFRKGGNVVIPSFAVGRTQELLYALNKHIENEKLKDITVYVDSPLAMESTKIFQKYLNYYDDEAKQYVRKGINPLGFKGLVFTRSPEESANINKIESGAIIISSSGMCDAGRIKHHLKHNLWRKECSIVFSGYQAEGTLGRTILDGAKKVKILGEEIAVNAGIFNLQALSGHADRQGLVDWLEALQVKPKEILIVHGDDEAQKSFKDIIKARGYNCRIMKLGDKYFINEENQNKENRTKIKERIIRLLDSVDDIEKMSKEEIIEILKERI